MGGDLGRDLEYLGMVMVFVVVGSGAFAGHHLYKKITAPPPAVAQEVTPPTFQAITIATEPVKVEIEEDPPAPLKKYDLTCLYGQKILFQGRVSYVNNTEDAHIHFLDSKEQMHCIRGNQFVCTWVAPKGQEEE